MSELSLTEGQQEAYEQFVSFLMDPAQKTFILKGYSGTGKSTLVQHILKELPNVLKTVRLLTQDRTEYKIALTATTNKAKEALQTITKAEVSTIQSFLGLRVKKNVRTNETSLMPSANSEVKRDYILFIDEASFVDAHLIGHIDSLTQGCKLVFVGDPAQLTPVKAATTPVFEGHLGMGYELTEVVRQAEGNPIIDLSTAFRHTVQTGQWFSFEPDGEHIIHMDRAHFEDAIIREFERPDWHHKDSKVLCWTNKLVISYNRAIREQVQGMPEFEVGDYAVCNKYIKTPNCNMQTDQMGLITKIEPSSDLGKTGNRITLDYTNTAFMPDTLDFFKEALADARKEANYGRIQYIENSWIDLRAAYACTINKSQGSTYNKVFIDLDDVSKCNNGNTVARMMYVAVSRARHQVIMAGDLA